MIKQKKITSATEAFSFLLECVPNLGKWKISPSERTHRLERMEFLLKRFDNPHLIYKTFHVAGTKGAPFTPLPKKEKAVKMKVSQQPSIPCSQSHFMI